MVKRYCNKGYINDIVSRVYGFIGNKGVDMVKLSDIYAECAQTQKYCDSIDGLYSDSDNMEMLCDDCNVKIPAEKLNTKKRFALRLVYLYGGYREKTKEEMLDFFNSLSL